MQRRSISFLFLNVGHFLDHFFMLIFATVAALRLADEWSLTYGELIPYATPGFIAFGACALIAGWLADKWSRAGMMAVFFIGIGISSVLSGLVSTPFGIAVTLTLVGVFAAIYHPVGLAMVVQGREKTGMPLAVNGVFGNLGVAGAALVTGYLIDQAGWRSAFIIPGVISVLIGLLYLFFLRHGGAKEHDTVASTKRDVPVASWSRELLIRVFAVVIFTTAVGGLIFQSTTFALPRILEEELTGNATWIGWLAFVVFAVAAFAQLLVGYLVDHFPIRPVFTVVALCQGVLFLIMTQVAGIYAWLVAFGFMLVVFGQIPINDVLVGRATRSSWRSRAYALRYIVTFSVMASAIPLIAWIHSNFGFTYLFGLLSVAGFLIFAATFFLPNAVESTHQPSTSPAAESAR